MPYASNSELPASVKNALPESAQTTWRKIVNAALKQYDGDETKAFATAWAGLKNAGWSKGKDGKWHMSKSDVQLNGTIAKVDEDRRLVFGWFSVIEKNGAQVEDLQGDLIDESELEQAAYDFVLSARVAGAQHGGTSVGRLVESMVFSKEKQRALGIDLGQVGWFGGFKIDDEEIWKAVKKGDYPAFSIGGEAIRSEISAE